MQPRINRRVAALALLLLAGAGLYAFLRYNHRPTLPPGIASGNGRPGGAFAALCP